MLKSRIPIVAAGSLALLATAAPADALTKDGAGYYKTGEAVAKKRIALVKVKVYRIAHFMRDLPVERSRAGVIAADTEKKFVWTILRDVDHRTSRLGDFRRAEEGHDAHDPLRPGQHAHHGHGPRRRSTRRPSARLSSPRSRSEALRHWLTSPRQLQRGRRPGRCCAAPPIAALL